MNTPVKLPVACLLCLTRYAEGMTNKIQDVERGYIQEDHKDVQVCITQLRAMIIPLERNLLLGQKSLNKMNENLSLAHKMRAEKLSSGLVTPSGAFTAAQLETPREKAEIVELPQREMPNAG